MLRCAGGFLPQDDISEVTKIHREALLYLNRVMNLPYAQVRFMVMMFKALERGDLKLSWHKHLRAFSFTRTLIHHNIKSKFWVLSWH